MGRGRTVKPGISFYRIDSGHILNKKVRLLYNEYDSDGYYIWSCILDKAYSEWGYYFDMNDSEEMELFAAEYCKKKLTLIQEVIAGCIRRGLFDKAVADLSGILTSDMMQETFLVATSERRAKGTIFDMHKEWVLLDFSQEVPPNISIVPVKKRILPGNKSILPRKNSQRREDKRIEEEKRGEDTPPDGDPGASAPAPTPLEVFRGLEKTKKSLYTFIATYKPDFIEPYVELWNFFASERKKPQISKVSDARRKKFHTRIKEKAFDFLAVLTRAGHAGDFLSTSTWFTWDWIMDSESNYLKVIEGNYDPDQKKKPAAGEPPADAKAVEFLYQRYLENSLQVKFIKETHCDYLLNAGMIELDERFILQAVEQRINNLLGSNQAVEIRMIQHYQEGTWPASPDCKADEPNRVRIAKKFALLEFFQQSKSLNRQTITNAAIAPIQSA
jgi:hypothetical protein